MENMIWTMIKSMSRRKLALLASVILAILFFAPIYPAVLPSAAYVTSINGLASLSFILTKQGFIIMGTHLYWGTPLFA